MNNVESRKLVRLAFVDNKSYDSGFVLLRYDVENDLLRGSAAHGLKVSCMLEVEQKYRVASLDEIRAKLVVLAGCDGAQIEQVDRYFAHPSRSFAQTDEALRVRRVARRNYVTYKGPKVDDTTKTRREIEVEIADGSDAAEQFTQLLTAVGFDPVATVRKMRTRFQFTWQSRPVDVALDRVDNLGTFVEIETSADEDDLDSARAVIASLADELNLADSERRGYLDLLLDRDA